MSSPLTTSPAVLIAVRERYQRLMLDLPAVQARVADALRLYEAELGKFDAVKGEMDELREFLAAQGEVVQRPVTSDSVTLSANMQILIRARAILADGKQRPTRDLFEELLRQGQVFTAANPVQRLSQLLSGSDWFVSDRTRGWSLAKGAAPTETGNSSPTEPSAHRPRED